MAERTTSPRLPIIISFVLFLGVVLGSFIAQLGAAQKGFDRWVGHEDHRLPNIRLVPEACRWAVIDRFIDLQPVDKADAFIFGDSQMFARGATQEELFYTQWLGAEATVINFSFLAAHISDMRKIADELHRRDINVPIGLQNINISHFTKSRGNFVPGGETPSSVEKGIYLRERPKLFGKIYQNRLLCAFKMRKILIQDSLRTPRYRKLLTKFSHVSLPDFFMNFDNQKFNASVPQHIESFENISANPIFITAPIAYDELDHYGFEVSKLDEFDLAFKTLCNDRPKMECHDLTRLMTHEGFMDMIHMNAVGHRYLGQKLKQTKAQK